MGTTDKSVQLVFRMSGIDELDRDWSEADTLGDAVLAAINNQMELGVELDQLLVGMLLGLLGFLKTVPIQEEAWPESLLRLKESANEVISELIDLRTEDSQ